MSFRSCKSGDFNSIILREIWKKVVAFLLEMRHLMDDHSTLEKSIILQKLGFSAHQRDEMQWHDELREAEEHPHP